MITFDVAEAESAFLEALEGVLGCPEFIDRIVAHAFDNDPADARLAAQSEHDRLVVEVANLTRGIATGHDIPALVEALRTRDVRLRELQRELAQPVIAQDRETFVRPSNGGLPIGEKCSVDRILPRRGRFSTISSTCRVRITNEPVPAWLSAANPGKFARGLVYSA